jgi:hypothetical protein
MRPILFTLPLPFSLSIANHELVELSDSLDEDARDRLLAAKFTPVDALGALGIFRQIIVPQ